MKNKGDKIRPKEYNFRIKIHRFYKINNKNINIYLIFSFIMKCHSKQKILKVFRKGKYWSSPTETSDQHCISHPRKVRGLGESTSRKQADSGFGGICSRISRGTPEARSRICVCRASFLMTFAMGGVPHSGPQQRTIQKRSS